MGKGKTMKKVLSMILCTICLLGTVGCDKEDKKCFYCENGKNLYVNSFCVKELSTTATCENGGTSTIQCEYCKRTRKIEVDKLGHDFKITKIEVTCLQDGYVYYDCQRTGCTETKKELKNAGPLYHNWIETNSKETVQYVYTDYKCSICNETKNDKTKINMGHQIKDTEDEFWYATSAAIRIVKEKLKYPSSAKFIKESQMEVHYNWISYFIEGAVSAPNAFGVYTDYYFIVKTKIRVSSTQYTWYDYDCILEQ